MKKTPPCKKCVVRARCINKHIYVLMNECKRLHTYLVSEKSGSIKTVRTDRLQEYCKIMDITIHKRGQSIRLHYRWTI